MIHSECGNRAWHYLAFSSTAVMAFASSRGRALLLGSTAGNDRYGTLPEDRFQVKPGIAKQPRVRPPHPSVYQQNLFPTPGPANSDFES